MPKQKTRELSRADKELRSALQIKRRKDGWWVENTPPYVVEGETFTSCGPYASKSEAIEGRKSVARAFGMRT